MDARYRNQWGIPEWLARVVTERDANCVYCRVEFSLTERRTKRSWEHIINDARIVTLENIALCCVGCNASKGAKPLRDWLEGDYCRRKGISRESVADVVRAALE